MMKPIIFLFETKGIGKKRTLLKSFTVETVLKRIVKSRKKKGKDRR